MSADQGIYVIIDGSGSMSDVKHDVVDGINQFIKEQQADIANTNDVVEFSLTSFDTHVNEVYIAEDITLVSPVSVKQTYLGGGTALLDAIGRTLTNAEDDAALRNIVVIYTDGHENSSSEFTRDQIKELIDRLDATGNWQFIYLGAEFADFADDIAYAGTLQGTADAINTSKSKVGQTWGMFTNTANYHRKADSSQYDTIKERGGLIATSSADAGVDWDAVDEDEILKSSKVTEPEE